MYKDIYERLGLTSSYSEELIKFMNRIMNTVEYINSKLYPLYRNKYNYELSIALGCDKKITLSDYFKENYNSTLIAAELLLSILEKDKNLDVAGGLYPYDYLKDKIDYSIKQSIIDLDISFDNDFFIKKGAQVLDAGLITDVLDYLNDFPKAKDYFSQALIERFRNDYKDVITKSYSAVESLVKTVLNTNKTLENSIDLLLKHLYITVEWKTIIACYCKYAHEYSSRHGKNDNSESISILKETDAESYLYLSGLIMRIIIKNIHNGA